MPIFLAIENANFNFWWQSSRETDWWECKLVQPLQRPELADGLDTGRGLRWESETMPRCLAWTVESVMCCLLSWGKWKRTGGEGDRSQCGPPKLKSGCVTLEVPTTRSRGDEHGMGVLGAQGKMCIQNFAVKSQSQWVPTCSPPTFTPSLPGVDCSSAQLSKFMRITWRVKNSLFLDVIARYSDCAGEHWAGPRKLPC